MKKLTNTLIGMALTLPFTTSAIAQAVANEVETDEVERIIVTASKRPQTIQDTAIAVSVTSSEDIEQAKVVDISDLQTLVPSLRVTPGPLSSVTSFAIRGFGSPATNVGVEPSVGVFIDGVFRSRAGGAISDLPRLQRVEVLSGPQSTLFGKNASAGVVSVITEAPSDVTEGRMEFSYGNYNQRIVKGYISGGVTDELSMSLSAGMNQRDGFTTSLQPGVPDHDDRDRWNIRSQAVWEISDDSMLRVIADFNKIDEICCTSPNIISGPVDGVITALGGAVIDGKDAFSRESVLIKSSTNDIDDGGISVHLDVDFEDFSLTSISAYRINDLITFNPVGSSSLDSTKIDRTVDISTFSQELRLTSTGDGPLSWIVGGFFFSEDIKSENVFQYGPSLRPYMDFLTSGFVGVFEGVIGVPVGTFFPDGAEIAYSEGQKNTDYSVFTSIDYQINDAFTGTIGLNYTKDKKEAFVKEVRNEDAFSAINLNTLAGGAFAGLSVAQIRPPIASFPNSVEDGKSDDSDTTYLVRLAYKHNENFNFYISQATGFKSSSWDLSNFTRPEFSIAGALDAAGENSSNPSYGSRLSSPEYATVTELGMKMWFKDIQANVAIFDQTLEDFQVRSFDGTNFFQGNAGKTSVDGMEFDIRYVASENWVFTLAGTLLDPIFDEFSNAPPGPNSPRDAEGNRLPQDLTGTKPRNIHEKSISAGVVYTQSFDNMDLFIRADYAYESELVIAPAGSITVDNPDITRQVNNLGASAGLHFDNGVSVQVWGRNLTEDENLLSVFGQSGQTGTVGAYINQPRTYGVSVAYQL
jgi:outer membrane receptor protein involved in Fe transport